LVEEVKVAGTEVQIKHIVPLTRCVHLNPESPGFLAIGLTICKVQTIFI